MWFQPAHFAHFDFPFGLDFSATKKAQIISGKNKFGLKNFVIHWLCPSISKFVNAAPKTKEAQPLRT